MTRVSLLLSGAVFAWGLLASAAEPVGTEARAGAAAPARAVARPTKLKKGKVAPSASAEELASAVAASST